MISNILPLHHQHLSYFDSIPNQVGTAILRASDGVILREPTGTLSSNDVEILYKMLLEVGTILGGSTTTANLTSNEKNSQSQIDDGVPQNPELLKRFNVERGPISFSVCVTTDGYVYMVKRRVESLYR